MKISFYKNLECIEKSNVYDLAKYQVKGTYYVQIINHIDTLLDWLTNLLTMTLSNKDRKIRFPLCKMKEILIVDVINLIKIELNNMINKNIERQQGFIEKKHFLLNEKNKNSTDEIIQKIKDCIEIEEKMIVDKPKIIARIKAQIDFLFWHKEKIRYFILKDVKFKDSISQNQIKSFYSYRVQLPAYSKELVYMENGKLLRTSSIYTKFQELEDEIRSKKISEFFQKSDFEYIEKDNILSIEELMNNYFDEIF